MTASRIERPPFDAIQYGLEPRPCVAKTRIPARGKELPREAGSGPEFAQHPCFGKAAPGFTACERVGMTKGAYVGYFTQRN